MFNKANDSELILGCVADDFTGGSDIASFLEQGGLKTILVNDIPSDHYRLPKGINALVIALKTRSEDIHVAVEQSLSAFNWLTENGARQLFFKYCSTFDSHRYGNIGPVIDGVIDHYHIPFTIISPALPINGRTVKNGNLYVHGIPLHKSSMKNHPLTPMWDSNIAELMALQGKYASINLNYDIIEKGVDILNIEFLNIVKGAANKPFYLILDHFTEGHARTIIKQFGSHSFLTGSSGLALELAAYHSRMSNRACDVDKSNIQTHKRGGAIILAGSCSEATCKQIIHFKQNNNISLRVDPLKLTDGSLNNDDFYRLIKENPSRNILFYGVDLEGDKRNSMDIKFSKLIESTMADIAEFAVNEKVERIIVAGGETAGAVAKKLGFKSYYIGPSVSSGVPVLIPEENSNLQLVFKSGNFGEEDFFLKALETQHNVI